MLSHLWKMISSFHKLVWYRSVCVRPRPKEEMERSTKGVFRQYLAAFCCSLSIFCSGVAFSWITPLLPRLTTAGPIKEGLKEWHLTADESSWAISLIEMGNVLSPLPAAFLVDRLGRKPLLLASAPSYVATWAITLALKSTLALYIVRFVQGIIMGFILTVLPMYLGEIAGPKIRGSLSIFFQAMWYLGVVYVVSIGPYVSYDFVTWLSLAPCVLYFLAVAFLPESPYFLLMRGRQNEARESLFWLRGAGEEEEIEKELSEIRESVEEEARNKATWRDVIGTPIGRKCLTIVNIIALTETLTGISPLIAYATQTFSETEGSPLNADISTILLAVGPVFVSLITLSLVDRIGRRPLILISSVGTTISLVVAASFYTFYDSTTPPPPPCLAWVPSASIIFYFWIVSFGIGPLVPTLQSELFPNSTRGIASAITTINLTFTSFLTLKLYQVIKDIYGISINFYIFSSFSTAGTICIYFFMPETKGKTFSEIQVMMSQGRMK